MIIIFDIYAAYFDLPSMIAPQPGHWYISLREYFPHLLQWQSGREKYPVTDVFEGMVL